MLATVPWSNTYPCAQYPQLCSSRQMWWASNILARPAFSVVLHVLFHGEGAAVNYQVSHSISAGNGFICWSILSDEDGKMAFVLVCKLYSLSSRCSNPKVARSRWSRKIRTNVSSWHHGIVFWRSFPLLKIYALCLLPRGMPIYQEHWIPAIERPPRRGNIHTKRIINCSSSRSKNECAACGRPTGQALIVRKLQFLSTWWRATFRGVILGVRLWSGSSEVWVMQADRSTKVRPLDRGSSGQAEMKYLRMRHAITS